MLSARIILAISQFLISATMAVALPTEVARDSNVSIPSSNPQNISQVWVGAEYEKGPPDATDDSGFEKKSSKEETSVPEVDIPGPAGGIRVKGGCSDKECNAPDALFEEDFPDSVEESGLLISVDRHESSAPEAPVVVDTPAKTSV